MPDHLRITFRVRRRRRRGRWPRARTSTALQDAARARRSGRRSPRRRRDVERHRAARTWTFGDAAAHRRAAPRRPRGRRRTRRWSTRATTVGVRVLRAPRPSSGAAMWAGTRRLLLLHAAVAGASASQGRLTTRRSWRWPQPARQRRRRCSTTASAARRRRADRRRTAGRPWDEAAFARAARRRSAPSWSTRRSTSWSRRCAQVLAAGARRASGG